MASSSINNNENKDDLEQTLNNFIPIPAEFKERTHLGAYSSFEGSPLSKGILQYDMWDVQPITAFNWKQLKEDVIKYGTRNSLLIAPMPTASTSQILGNNECFEPLTSLMYTRRTLAGEFILANKYLIDDLISLDLWNDDIKNILLQIRVAFNTMILYQNI